MPIEISNIAQLGSLEFLARQIVEGFITGLHKSPFHGFSVEFAEHRLYNTGEPTKNIDWKLFARTEKLFVKRYEEETNLRCQIVIDKSSSMHFPVQNKLDFDVAQKPAMEWTVGPPAPPPPQWHMEASVSQDGRSMISDWPNYPLMQEDQFSPPVRNCTCHRRNGKGETIRLHCPHSACCCCCC